MDSNNCLVFFHNDSTDEIIDNYIKNNELDKKEFDTSGKYINCKYNNTNKKIPDTNKYDCVLFPELDNNNKKIDFHIYEIENIIKKINKVLKDTGCIILNNLNEVYLDILKYYFINIKHKFVINKIIYDVYGKNYNETNINKDFFLIDGLVDDMIESEYFSMIYIYPLTDVNNIIDVYKKYIMLFKNDDLKYSDNLYIGDFKPKITTQIDKIKTIQKYIKSSNLKRKYTTIDLDGYDKMCYNNIYILNTENSVNKLIFDEHIYSLIYKLHTMLADKGNIFFVNNECTEYYVPLIIEELKNDWDKLFVLDNADGKNKYKKKLMRDILKINVYKINNEIINDEQVLYQSIHKLRKNFDDINDIVNNEVSSDIKKILILKNRICRNFYGWFKNNQNQFIKPVLKFNKSNDNYINLLLNCFINDCKLYKYSDEQINEYTISINNIKTIDKVNILIKDKYITFEDNNQISVVFTIYCYLLNILIQIPISIEKILNVASYTDFFPVSYKKDKDLVGSDIDIIKDYCKIKNINPKLIPYDYWGKDPKKDINTNIWDLPFEKEYDISIGGIGTTFDRIKDNNIQWTIPYFFVKRTLIYNKKLMGKINTLDDFEKKIKESIYDNMNIKGTYKSTGWEDAEIRNMGKRGETSRLEKGTDETDIDDLNNQKILGFMRGSFVGCSLIKKYTNFGMLDEWEIYEGIVPYDTEVFAFPCKHGTGLAESLTLFMLNNMDYLNNISYKHNLSCDEKKNMILIFL